MTEEYLYTSGQTKTSARPGSDGLPITDINPVGSSKLSGKTKNVSAAGTAVQLDDTSFDCREVTVIAKKSNTGSIYVGGSDVSSSIFGVELKANESFTFPVKNANLIYINGAVSGEGVSYVAL